MLRHVTLRILPPFPAGQLGCLPIEKPQRIVVHMFHPYSPYESNVRFSQTHATDRLSPNYASESGQPQASPLPASHYSQPQAQLKKELRSRLKPKQSSINTITPNSPESRVRHRAFLSEVLSHEKESHYTLYAVPVASLEISRSEN
jgi:hypothetical protein